jgi:pimeloyl-ACP methyl ester carboxylesterase
MIGEGEFGQADPRRIFYQGPSLYKGRAQNPRLNEGERMETIIANGLRFAARCTGDAGPWVLLLHGFPDDAGTFDALAQSLAEAGFRCCAPYMRGYHPTSRPLDDDYSLAALASDVVGLADATAGPEQQVFVVGHDWGAAAAWCAGVMAPGRFAGLVGMAVPPLRWFLRGLYHDPRQLARSWYMLALQTPVLAEAILSAHDFALIEVLWRNWSPGWNWTPERIGSVKDTFRGEGTVRASVSYYRALLQDVVRRPAIWRESWRLAQAPISVPSLVLAGGRDGCIGPRVFAGVQGAFAATCSFGVIADAGHFLHLERPDLVAARITNFLSQLVPAGQP